MLVPLTRRDVAYSGTFPAFPKIIKKGADWLLPLKTALCIGNQTKCHMGKSNKYSPTEGVDLCMERIPLNPVNEYKRI